MADDYNCLSQHTAMSRIYCMIEAQVPSRSRNHLQQSRTCCKLAGFMPQQAQDSEYFTSIHRLTASCSSWACCWVSCCKLASCACLCCHRAYSTLLSMSSLSACKLPCNVQQTVNPRRVIADLKAAHSNFLIPFSLGCSIK